MNKELMKEYRHILDHIDQIIKTKKQVIIVIDGKCGAGKSTLGRFLQQYYQASLIFMDDFFLQSHQRTKERLLEPGGNIDYERFKDEIIAPLLLQKDIRYHRFDCSQMKLSEDVQIISYRSITIIEGTYSLHPYFGHYYDLSIVLDISPQTQEKRLLQREGKEKFELFKKKWIPLEQRYFENDDIYSKANIIF